MDLFSPWGIRKDVSGARVRYLADCGDGSVKSLKSRQDVVLFLSRNPKVGLKPEDFLFKFEASPKVEIEIDKVLEPME